MHDRIALITECKYKAWAGNRASIGCWFSLVRDGANRIAGCWLHRPSNVCRLCNSDITEQSTVMLRYAVYRKRVQLDILNSTMQALP